MKNNERTTILIAEDEEVNYLFFQEFLTNLDYKVLHAKNGAEAVEYCRNNKEIRLVLMDMKMPILSGYDATKQIKAFRSSLPIVAQTAYALANDRKKVLEAGCDDYIAKPIHIRELKKILDKYL